jgi:putative transposase
MSITADSDWPHAPVHRLSERGTYFVTAGTYGKHHHFKGKLRLSVLQRGLLSVCRDASWRLEAWAVFSNHYHFVAESPENQDSAESLQAMLAELHFKTASWVNKLDKARGRKVWHNYWETHLSFEQSYLARLNYVHQNPVHHGLLGEATKYPYCSAAWFERTASNAQIAILRRFKADRVKILDEYTVSPDW